MYTPLKSVTPGIFETRQHILSLTKVFLALAKRQSCEAVGVLGVVATYLNILVTTLSTFGVRDLAFAFALRLYRRLSVFINFRR